MIKYSPIKGGGEEVMQVTYLKKDGTTIKRNRNTMLPYKVGDTTSMGWKVLNIHYLYEGNYYTYLDYKRIIRGKQLKKKREKKLLKYLIRQLNKLV